MEKNYFTAMQKAALLYLDRTGGINTIRERCLFYEKVQDKAFSFTVSVDPCQILELDERLGEYVLHCPGKAYSIFQQVVFAVISGLQLLPHCTLPGQVVVGLRVLSLPSLPEYQATVKEALQLSGRKKHFLQCKGIVTGLSTHHKYTKMAKYLCSDSTCAGAEGNKFIRLHVPGARETQTIRSDFTCSLCGAPLQEDISYRILADRLVLEMVDNDALLPALNATRHQALTVHLREDLTQGIKIGQSLNVIGQLSWEPSQASCALEAVNVLTSMPEKCPTHDLEKLPSTIKTLYNDRRNSPWSFTLSLAFAFGGHVTPPGSYLQLKLGLLLSLVAPTAKEPGGLDVLAVGNDTLLLHRLLLHASSFRRCVLHTWQNPFTATLTKDRHGTGASFIQGGSLLLAHDGVCVVPDLRTAKKSAFLTLKQVLEQQVVPVEMNACSGMASQPVLLPRRCRIWSYTAPVGDGREQTPVLADTDPLSKPVIVGKRDIQVVADIFGLVYLTDAAAESYADFACAHHCLQSAMHQDTQPLISSDDFKEFLDYASSLDVDLSRGAEWLIRGYYVASRRARCAGGMNNDSSTVSVTAINTVTSLAVAHAKLSLRSEVTPEDALMAVYLYEETITTRYGSSMLHIQPLPHVKNSRLSSHIGKERDDQLHLFDKQLRHFIATYATDLEE